MVAVRGRNGVALFCRRADAHLKPTDHLCTTAFAGNLVTKGICCCLNPYTHSTQSREVSGQGADLFEGVRNPMFEGDLRSNRFWKCPVQIELSSGRTVVSGTDISSHFWNKLRAQEIGGWRWEPCRKAAKHEACITIVPRISERDSYISRQPRALCLLSRALFPRTAAQSRFQRGLML